MQSLFSSRRPAAYDGSLAVRDLALLISGVTLTGYLWYASTRGVGGSSRCGGPLSTEDGPGFLPHTFARSSLGTKLCSMGLNNFEMASLLMLVPSSAASNFNVLWISVCWDKFGRAALPGTILVAFCDLVEMHRVLELPRMTTGETITGFAREVRLWLNC